MRRAVGTSFTLDLMALLTAPLAFTFFDAHDENGAPLADPVALLEALRRHAENVTLFCQAGAISVPSPDQTLLAYLERSVIEVKPEAEGGIFHPKVWVLDFESEKRPAIYRVLCLSRNLTFARSWDTCVSLEGELKEEGDYPRNEPFADLLLQLPRLAIRETRPELREDLKRMADEIRRVDFKTPRPFADFKVHSFGLNGSHLWPFPKAGRSLVISPFLSGSTVRGLVREHGLEVLISRPEALADVVRRVGRDALPRTCYVLSPGAGLDARDAEEGEEQADGPPRAAFHGNVEVLVELVGRSKDCGIDALLGLEEDPKLETLRSLLHEYHPEPPPECTETEPCKELEREADQLARLLAAVPYTATAQHVDSEQLWDITLSGELPELPDGPKVKVWPATLPSMAALRIDGIGEALHEPVDPAEPTDAIVTFKRMSFEALTGFFAFEVSLQKEQCEVRHRFAVTAELVGVPENRKERLLRSLLQDRRRVLQLLFLILMGEGADALTFLQAERRDGMTAQGPFGGWGQGTLLEALLRTLSRNPRQIDDVARLISDLERTPEGKELLPKGLSEIWEPVWAAREALRS
ncbi:MAG: hypothetical protein F4X18_07790 [Acidimicrobiia bacterium]|nr:hypothetical protein [Acidimicrobiia bacterium]